jgi:hypothetical protein
MSQFIGACALMERKVIEKQAVAGQGTWGGEAARGCVEVHRSRSTLVASGPKGNTYAAGKNTWVTWCV